MHLHSSSFISTIIYRTTKIFLVSQLLFLIQPPWRINHLLINSQALVSTTLLAYNKINSWLTITINANSKHFPHLANVVFSFYKIILLAQQICYFCPLKVRYCYMQTTLSILIQRPGASTKINNLKYRHFSKLVTRTKEPQIILIQVMKDMNGAVII